MHEQPDLWIGADHTTQYLLTVFTDGTHYLCMRPLTETYTQHSITWGPPVEMTPEPLQDDPFLNPTNQ